MLVTLDVQCPVCFELACKPATRAVQAHRGGSSGAPHRTSDLRRIELLPVAQQERFAIGGGQAPEGVRKVAVVELELYDVLRGDAAQAFTESATPRRAPSLFGQHATRDPV